MTIAINSSLNCKISGTVSLLPTTYAISTTILPSSINCPITFQGTSDNSGLGTIIKWMGGNNDSMLQVGRYMVLKNLYLYNGNASTLLIGIDSLAIGTTYTTAHYVVTMEHVQVSDCYIGYAFNNTYEIRSTDCFVRNCTIGFDVRTATTTLNFYNCHIITCYTGITDKNGIGCIQLLWDTGTIEGCYTYGIDMAMPNSSAVEFHNTYFEANTQHRLSNRVKLLNVSIDHDGEANHCFTAPGVPLVADQSPFDIISATYIVIECGGLYIGATTTLCTFSGNIQKNTSGDYGSGSILLKDKLQLSGAKALYANDILMFGKIDTKSYKILETPMIDASVAYLNNILTVDELWKTGNLTYVVDAYLVVETAIATTATAFLVKSGYSGLYNQIFDYTFALNTIAVGTYRIPLTGAAPVLIYPYAYSYAVSTTAETSGRFKIVLITI
jgi:hypothetical protein